MTRGKINRSMGNWIYSTAQHYNYMTLFLVTIQAYTLILHRLLHLTRWDALFKFNPSPFKNCQFAIFLNRKDSLANHFVVPQFFLNSNVVFLFKIQIKGILLLLYISKNSFSKNCNISSISHINTKGIKLQMSKYIWREDPPKRAKNSPAEWFWVSLWLDNSFGLVE